ncbi:MAG: hypothetical protein HRU28_03365 [Rhizobiales bacterium]|nr:hypothetical protein [Hyphomicrobiales bacterium]
MKNIHILDDEVKTELLHLHNTGLRPLDIAHKMKIKYDIVYNFLRSHQLIKTPLKAKFVFAQPSGDGNSLIELVGFCKTNKTHVYFPLTRKDLKFLLELGLVQFNGQSNFNEIASSKVKSKKRAA